MIQHLFKIALYEWCTSGTGGSKGGNTEGAHSYLLCRRKETRQRLPMGNHQLLAVQFVFHWGWAKLTGQAWSLMPRTSGL